MRSNQEEPIFYRNYNNPLVYPSTKNKLFVNVYISSNMFLANSFSMLIFKLDVSKLKFLKCWILMKLMKTKIWLR